MLIQMPKTGFAFCRKNFQRILKKQGMNFKLNTKVTGRWLLVLLKKQLIFQFVKSLFFNSLGATKNGEIIKVE